MHSHESAMGVHVSPSWTPLPPPTPTHPAGLSQSTSSECCVSGTSWTGNLFHIWWYPCFNDMLSNHPMFTLSQRVQSLNFISGGAKIIADDDCSHEIKRHLLLGKESDDQTRQHIIKQRHCFVKKCPSSQSMVFPVVMYGYESWAVKKIEHQRIDAFELWCWRRLLRIPCIVRGSSQSMLKEISSG